MGCGLRSLFVSYKRITIDPNVMGGLPCIRDLAIPAGIVAAMAADGMTIERIVTFLPVLTLDDVTEALHYAVDVSLQRAFEGSSFSSPEARQGGAEPPPHLVDEISRQVRRRLRTPPSART